MGVGVAREKVQKDLDWQYNDWGVNALSEDEVRQRLQKDGYKRLAADPDAPRKIKDAAASKTLAVWTVGAHRDDRFVTHRRAPRTVAQTRTA